MTGRGVEHGRGRQTGTGRGRQTGPERGGRSTGFGFHFPKPKPKKDTGEPSEDTYEVTSLNDPSQAKPASKPDSAVPSAPQASDKMFVTASGIQIPELPPEKTIEGSQDEAFVKSSKSKRLGSVPLLLERFFNELTKLLKDEPIENAFTKALELQEGDDQEKVKSLQAAFSGERLSQDELSLILVANVDGENVKMQLPHKVLYSKNMSLETQAKCVAQWLEAGFDPQKVDGKGNMLIDLAVARNNQGLVELLIKKGAKPDFDKEQNVYSATVFTDNHAMLKSLCEAFPPDKPKLGGLYMMACSKDNQSKVTQYLYSLIKEKYEEAQSPAAPASTPAAPTSTPAAPELTPVAAVSEPAPSSVSPFEQGRPDLDKCRILASMFKIVADKGDLKSELLRNRDEGKLQLPDDLSIRVPVLTTLENNEDHEEVITLMQLLLREYVPQNVKNLNALLELGGYSNDSGLPGYSPLQLVSRYRRYDYIKPLLDHMPEGIDFKAQSAEGHTLLHYICYEPPLPDEQEPYAGFINGIKLLLDAGVDPDLANKYGATPYRFPGGDALRKISLERAVETAKKEAARETVARYTSLMKSLKPLKEQLATKTTELEAALKAQKEAEEMQSNLEAALKAQEDANAGLHTQSAQKKEKLERQLQSVRTERHDAQKEKAKLEKQVKSLQQQLELAKDRFGEVEEINLKLHDQLQEQADEVKKKEDLERALQQQLVQAKRRASEAEGRSARLRQSDRRVHEAEKKIVGLQGTLIQAGRRASEAEARASEAEARAMEAEARAAKAEARAMEAENRLRRFIESAESQNEALAGENTLLKNQSAEKEAQNQRLQAALQEQEKLNAALAKQLDEAPIANIRENAHQIDLMLDMLNLSHMFGFDDTSYPSEKYIVDAYKKEVRKPGANREELRNAKKTLIARTRKLDNIRKDKEVSQNLALFGFAPGAYPSERDILTVLTDKANSCNNKQESLFYQAAASKLIERETVHQVNLNLKRFGFEPDTYPSEREIDERFKNMCQDRSDEGEFRSLEGIKDALIERERINVNVGLNALGFQRNTYPSEKEINAAFDKMRLEYELYHLEIKSLQTVKDKFIEREQEHQIDLKLQMLGLERSQDQSLPLAPVIEEAYNRTIAALTEQDKEEGKQAELSDAKNMLIEKSYDQQMEGFDFQGAIDALFLSRGQNVKLAHLKMSKNIAERAGNYVRAHLLQDHSRRGQLLQIRDFLIIKAKAFQADLSKLGFSGYGVVGNVCPSVQEVKNAYAAKAIQLSLTGDRDTSELDALKTLQDRLIAKIENI